MRRVGRQIVVRLIDLCFSAKLTWLGPPQFDIALSTMQLIYLQTIGWLGFYFSPLLTCLLLGFFVLTYFLKLVIIVSLNLIYEPINKLPLPSLQATLRWNCGLFNKPWRAAQSETVFLTFLLVSQLIAMFTYSYITVR